MNNRTELTDEVLDRILKDLSINHTLAIADYASENYDLEYSDSFRVAEIFVNEGLANYIASDKIFMRITELGRQVAKKGYKEHKTDLIKKNTEANQDLQIQRELAITNIEANNLNIKNAARNQEKENLLTVREWINVAIGALNLGLLFYQIYKGLS